MYIRQRSPGFIGVKRHLVGHGVDQGLDVDGRRGVDAAAFDVVVELVDVEAHLQVVGAVGLVPQALLGLVPFELGLAVGAARALVARRAPAQLDAVIGIERDA